jgi:hypothetical protein
VFADAEDTHSNVQFIESDTENYTDGRDTKLDDTKTSDTTTTYDQTDILISQMEQLPEVHEHLLRTEPSPELPQTADETHIHDVKVCHLTQSL